VKETLAAIADLVRRESGISLGSTQHATIRAALKRALPNLEPAAFLHRVPRDRSLMAQLLDELTVKETYFLRERDQLDAIDWRAVADEARSEGASEVRVWCAPCATGEEAYSLALLASAAFAPAVPPVSILATDISGDALARAGEGAYRARSVRDVEPALRRRYFEEDGDRLVVGGELRSLVTFAQHNLVSDPPPVGAPFHLVLCRNVLIYFDGETVDRVLGTLEASLTHSGTLHLGAADALCASARKLMHTGARALAPDRRPPQRRPRLLRRPLGRAEQMPTEEPKDPDGHFLRGLEELESGDASAAVASLRRALFADPGFSLAAFTLGRAHEATGDVDAARRAYGQALRTLDAPGDGRSADPLGVVETEEIVAAATARLAALVPTG
jgi:chemotaxis protein methyltransferase CheR